LSLFRRAFNSEYLAHFYAVRREGGYAPTTVAVADRIRNVLVLLPIALTWFALYESTKAYREYIDAHPNEISQPFKTQYGWHIIQLLGRRQFDNSEEIVKQQAFNTIRNSKVDEETELWLRRLRDEAYVEYRL